VLGYAGKVNLGKDRLMNAQNVDRKWGQDYLPVRLISEMTQQEIQDELTGIGNAGFTMDYFVEACRASARADALRAALTTEVQA
jgi:hypothetical protein